MKAKNTNSVPLPKMGRGNLARYSPTIASRMKMIDNAAIMRGMTKRKIGRRFLVFQKSMVMVTMPKIFADDTDFLREEPATI